MITLEIGKLYEIYNPDELRFCIFKNKKGEESLSFLVSGDVLMILEVCGHQYKVICKDKIGWIDCDEDWKSFVFKKIE
jgi:hypothetical protein